MVMRHDRLVQRPSRTDPFSDELAALTRAHRDTVQVRRVDELLRRLDAGGPMQVSRCRRNLAGDRITLELENRWRVKLWLFWPRRRAVVELSRMFWHDEIGWVIDTLDDDAQPMRCFGWRAHVTLPSG
jgi:hypothetical protein